MLATMSVFAIFICLTFSKSKTLFLCITQLYSLFLVKSENLGVFDVRAVSNINETEWTEIHSMTYHHLNKNLLFIVDFGVPIENNVKNLEMKTNNIGPLSNSQRIANKNNNDRHSKCLQTSIILQNIEYRNVTPRHSMMIMSLDVSNLTILLSQHDTPLRCWNIKVSIFG